MFGSRYSQGGGSFFNHLRARYCRFMLYMRRGQLLLKLFLSLFALGVGIFMAFMMNRGLG